MGKGPLDGVYIAGGCVLPCTGGAPQPFNGGASVFVDRGNLTKPYPNNPPSGPLSSRRAPGTWPRSQRRRHHLQQRRRDGLPAGYFTDWFNPTRGWRQYCVLDRAPR